MKVYRAYCKDHNWEGAKQVKKEDAEKDLDAHKLQYPDETHKDSGVN